MPSNNKVTLKAHEILHLKLRKGNTKNSYRLNDQQLEDLCLFLGF